MKFLWFLVKWNISILCLVSLLVTFVDIVDTRVHFLIIFAWAISHGPALISYLEHGDWLS